jgi:microcin C transport system substrate-binding protein
MITRTVTPSQYIERVGNYDYELAMQGYPESETPGNEQRQFWGSKAADTNNAYNFAGLKSPVVDELIELLINSPDRPTLTARVRALDRILLWEFLGILNWYSKLNRLAYWNKFGQPKIKPKDGIGFSTWWIDPALEKKLGR